MFKINAKETIGKLTTSVMKATGKATFKARKASPEICLALGIGTGIAAAVLACKETMRADEVLDKFAEGKEKAIEAKKIAEETGETNYSYGKEMAFVYRDAAFGFVKLYWPSVLLEGVSIGFLLSSFGIMKKRQIELFAAYTGLEGAFKRYRKRVAEKYGEEAEKELSYGLKKATAFVVEKDEKGKEKVVEREVPTIDDVVMEDASNYGRLFSPMTTAAYQNGGWYYNEAFLRGQEQYFTDILNTRGYVFLSEVYHALGFEMSPASRLVGWLKDSPNDDGYVSFGLKEPIYREAGEHVMKTGRVVNTLSGRDYLLDFNVDGVIWNLI